MIQQPLLPKPEISKNYDPQSNIILHCGDSYEFFKELPANLAALIITSPPYNIGKIYEKYERAQANEVRFEEYRTEDAETVIVAFGIASRIAKGAVNRLRSKGVKVGLFRPITLWPFPQTELRTLASQGRRFLVAELNTGQMVEDVKLAVGAGVTVDFVGKWGGTVPTEAEIESKIRRLEVVAV